MSDPKTYSTPVGDTEAMLETLLYGRRLTDAESIFVNNLKSWLENVHGNVVKENTELRKSLKLAVEALEFYSSCYICSRCNTEHLRESLDKIKANKDFNGIKK